jgi:putative peptidoglycan lipid II flippase
MFNKIANTAIIITSITLLSKLAGFMRDVVLAASYGTTMDSDAFIMAQSIIGVFTNLVIVALGTTFIPVMSDYKLYKSKDETNNFVNAVYTFSTGLTIVLCIFCMAFSKQLVGLFAPSFSDETNNLTNDLLWILLPTTVLTTLITLNNAKLQNHGSYLVAASIGLPLNFLMIFTMFFFTDSFGIHGLTIAIVIGTMFQLILQLPFTRKLGYSFKLNFDLKEEGLRRIGILIFPIMIGTGIQQINTMVDRILASGLPEGSIAALSFSIRLGLFITGLLSAVVVSVYYTSMSNYYSSGKDEAFKKLLRNTINVSTVLIVPASIGFMTLRLPIVKLLFERGMFDSTASEMTAIALFYYTIGLIGFLLRDVLSRALYAIKDTKTAMINGSIAVGLNIVFSLLFVRYLGLGGLALGTSISGIVSSILLMISLRKKIGDYGLRNVTEVFIKTLIASLGMGVTVYYCYEMMFETFSSNLLSVLVSVIMGVIIYGILLLLFKIDEVNSIKHIVLAHIKSLRQRRRD